MHRTRGFNLLELMISLAIITTLATIAYPAYQDHLIAVRRSDGQTALMHLAALMEQYYTENNTYIGATLRKVGLVSPASPAGFYQLNITTHTATTYSLIAAPTPGGPQMADVACGTLTLTNTNIKGPDPNICWN